jgi:hypothetical protein
VVVELVVDQEVVVEDQVDLEVVQLEEILMEILDHQHLLTQEQVVEVEQEDNQRLVEEYREEQEDLVLLL